jgi:apolipoprotein D and lipocalin family protein
MKNIRKISLSLGLGIAAVLLLNSCSIGLPNGAKAVTNFQADKYLGKWYEIARFDFRFEKNLNQVTATYSKNEKGNIIVENRGYDYVKNEWK